MDGGAIPRPPIKRASLAIDRRRVNCHRRTPCCKRSREKKDSGHFPLGISSNTQFAFTALPPPPSFCSIDRKTAETMKKEMMGLMEDELFPSTPGKVKIERTHAISRQLHQCFASTSTMFLWALFLIALTASYLSFQSFVDSSSRYFDASWGGMQWEKQIRASATVRRPGGFSVLVTGAAGFVGTHVSLALRKRGDGVVGLDNFNSYYDPSLKKARMALLDSRGVFVVEGDINDARLLAKLFDVVPFTHVMHLAAQAGVRYAIENPASYVHSNIAGLVALLEACKSADPQPAVVWASSSSVYGLNEKVPFSESDRTDRPASLYAATKKAGEEITHTYNHIYGLSTTGLRFFTVYGPWGRPDMAYFSFTRNILQGKPITVYRGKDRVDLARDFTYIDDIVKGCVASLDTAEKSTGTGGRKRGPAQYRIYNLGNTSPVTVPALVGVLEHHLKMKAKRNVVEMPGNGDVPFTHANISLARAELGYKPTTNLETGLKRFVRWYLLYYGYNTRSGGLAGSAKSL
ncbi:RmlD substrate binding domain [Musa troglodytarum]|uniref:UDP-glucuronate 4-epimerase n=1 Tax=Musa troglodytarum TaxID=320322 RepID=A0A9E7JSR2_9LILI|nr:RmlD substrate binding domain [Musa troglodytarum]